jgi:uroporphyrinogen-III synthase
MKIILITRPKNQAQELVKFFEKQKIKTFVEPLFEVEELAIDKIAGDFSAVIITSINACHALEKSGISKALKIFTIGKKTAQKLQEIGFTNIIYSPENSVNSLLDLIKNYQGQILYLRGEKISLDLAKTFKNISEVIVYKTHENKDFSAELLEFCRTNSFAEILLFSQNSAEIFFKLAKKHNLLEYFQGSQIVCLSEKILNSVSKFGFKNVKTFSANPILKNFYE